MQCYSGKNIKKGIEFCDSNFDPEEDSKNFLLCYESIPAFNMEYCQLKYERDIVSKIDCFKNKAKLTLD
jgi:hypothetical protein